MLKGLYFKLHDDNEVENTIIQFFDEETKRLGITKMELLKICIKAYYLVTTMKGLK